MEAGTIVIITVENVPDHQGVPESKWGKARRKWAQMNSNGCQKLCSTGTEGNGGLGFGSVRGTRVGHSPEMTWPRT